MVTATGVVYLLYVIIKNNALKIGGVLCIKFMSVFDKWDFVAIIVNVGC